MQSNPSQPTSFRVCHNCTSILNIYNVCKNSQSPPFQDNINQQIGNSSKNSSSSGQAMTSHLKPVLLIVFENTYVASCLKASKQSRALLGLAFVEERDRFGPEMLSV